MPFPSNIIGLFLFYYLLLSFERSLSILDTSFLFEKWFAKIFRLKIIFSNNENYHSLTEYLQEQILKF